jgi:hypothetical protein
METIILNNSSLLVHKILSVEISRENDKRSITVKYKSSNFYSEKGILTYTCDDYRSDASFEDDICTLQNYWPFKTNYQHEPENEKTKQDLETFLTDIDTVISTETAANILGVSKSTVKYDVPKEVEPLRDVPYEIREKVMFGKGPVFNLSEILLYKLKKAGQL